MEHKQAVNQKQHRHADLLRMAADNADQLFECDEIKLKGKYYINKILEYPFENWRPVKTTKTIKRWLWTNKDNKLTVEFYSEEEINKTSNGCEFTKLIWSETEFEVEDAH